MMLLFVRSLSEYGVQKGQLMDVDTDTKHYLPSFFRAQKNGPFDVSRFLDLKLKLFQKIK